jgi:collagenase-like PrtC family protease
MEMTPPPQLRRARLALAPIPYYWPRNDVFAFYEAAATWPIDTVYLGETVCARRHELRLADWLQIGELLAAAGKEVVLSTLGLVEGEADLRQVRAVADNGGFLVEANDMNAVQLLAERVPFVAGAALNVYNAGTLKLLQSVGALRWVAPIDLAASAVRRLLADLDAPIETEFFAHGRLPLAMSARCFTARYHNLSKDRCEYRCLQHPSGIALRTLDGRALFTINGVQTQSAHVTTQLGDLDALLAARVDLVRICPQTENAEAVVRLFDAVLTGARPPEQAVAQARQIEPNLVAAPEWHAGGGGDHTRRAHA